MIKLFDFLNIYFWINNSIIIIICILAFNNIIHVSINSVNNNIDPSTHIILDKIVKDKMFYNSKEYALCVNGNTYLDNGSVIFNLNEVIEVFQGNNISVTSHCTEGIAHIHSHPNINSVDECRASNSDIITWKEFLKDGVVIFLIQCSSDKAVVYTQEDWSKGYVIKLD